MQEGLQATAAAGAVINPKETWADNIATRIMQIRDQQADLCNGVRSFADRAVGDRPMKENEPDKPTRPGVLGSIESQVELLEEGLSQLRSEVERLQGML